MNTLISSRPRMIIDIIRLLLIFLFVYAALTKLMVYNLFVVQIGLSPLLPNVFKKIAWIIPAGELIISIMLIWPATMRAGLYLSFVLMLSFTLYITAILTVSDYIPCSCGGVLAELSWGEHLIVNVIYLVMTIIGIVLHEKKNLYQVRV